MVPRPPPLVLLLASLGCAEKGVADPDDSVFEAEDTGPAEARPFSLLSLNLHCLKLEGTAYASNAERFDAVAALAAAEDVAVITAQELCAQGEQDARTLLEEAMERTTGASWSSAATVAHVAWEGTEDEALESVGLLVRGALSDLGSLTYAVQGGLNRVATYATLPAELGGAVVWSVHLEVLDEASRAAQARQTGVASLTVVDPSVNALVAGDLNAVEGSEPHAAFLAAGFADLSADLEADRIDHVFAHRGAPLAATSARLAFDGASEPPVSDHPGVLVALAPAEPEAVTLTRITASATLGEGHFLSIRGGVAPLSWDWGWPAIPLDAATWRVVLSELPEGDPFEYKALVDDTTWQSGDNATGEGGADNTLSPSF